MTKMNEISPDKYSELIDDLTRKSVLDFRFYHNDSNKQRMACCRYFKRGRIADLSTSELVDFLGVSSPSILELAGYSDKEANRVMKMIASLKDDEIDGTTLF